MASSSSSLKKLIVECNKLTEYRDKYYQQKRDFLGLTCIASCLYQKPVREFIEITDLPKSYDQFINRIETTKEDQLVICSYMGSLKKFHLLYDEKLIECKELLRKYVKNSSIDISRLKYVGIPVVKTKSKIQPIKLIHELALPSLAEDTTRSEIKRTIVVRKVYAQLYQNSDTFAITFERRWSFRTTCSKPVDPDVENIFVQHSNSDVFDFFGFVSYVTETANILCVPFVIQCVSEVLDPQEIAKLRCQQYILYQMNINFLYLNPNTRVEKLVDYFLKKLCETTDYLALGTIRASKFIDTDDNRKTLRIFYEDYRSNHVNTLKHQKYLRAITKRDDTTKVVLVDSKAERKKLKNIGQSINLPDQGYTVSESDFQSIVSKNYIFSR